MKRIDISTPKYPNTFAIVDDEDYPELSKHRWICERGYVRRHLSANGKHKRIGMHHEVLGHRSPVMVDHINGVRYDNRKENLRYCTTQQNNCNMGPKCNNKSGYKGVSYDAVNGMWRACISINYTSVTIGRFKTAKEAAEAYDAMASEKFGEFARTNKSLGLLNPALTPNPIPLESRA